MVFDIGYSILDKISSFFLPISGERLFLKKGFGFFDGNHQRIYIFFIRI